MAAGQRRSQAHHPTTSDIGLHDQAASLHYTSITGTTTNAALQYGARLRRARRCYSLRRQERRLIYFFLTVNNSTNALEAVTTVATNPTIYQNGVAIEQNGPFWTPNSQQIPFIVYETTNTILPTDVITYSAADSWIGGSSGLSVCRHGGAGR